MYATNKNQQALESRERIRDALLVLLRKNPYKDISITQICQEAQIVRQTYYRNFEQKDDILRFHLDRMVGLYFSEYFKENDVKAQLKTFFEYMLQNSGFLILVSENDLFFMIEAVITQNIESFLDFRQITNTDDPGLEKYATRFIAATICSLLSLWVTSGFDESPDIMSALAQRFLAGVSNEKRRAGGIVS